MEATNELRPFGEASCEDELKILGPEEYSRYYFDQTRFNNPSMDRRTFLIIGRRGSGKTSLEQHFSFQKVLKNAIAINKISEPELFEDIISRISSSMSNVREVEIPKLEKVWNYLIWHIIFYTLQARDERIRVASLMHAESGTVPHLLINVLKTLLGRLLGTKDNNLFDEFEQLLSQTQFQEAKDAVLEIARKEPIIVAIDTLENYSVSNSAMMNIVASLIQCGANFNRDYSHRNIHLKIFVMAEVFPYFKEDILQNTLKHIHDEVYLHWRPKDLMRLISWRFHYYLKSRSILPNEVSTLDWDNYRDVLTKIWEPFFGREIKNGNHLVEKTFPYVLRHTQMRPRQLIVLCNSIFEEARRNNQSNKFSEQVIIAGIRSVENRLSEEVLNSYNTVYPNVGRIIDALYGIPVKFKGSELDKRAPTTASQWGSDREYSPFNFRQLVAELGVVGRIRNQHASAGFIEADFEYASEGRLPLLPTDECVIHPMFYKRLNVRVEPKVRVYPFPDHPEFKDLDYWGE